MLSENRRTPDGTLRLWAGVLLCLACVAATDKAKPDQDSLLYLILTTMALHGPILIGTAIILKGYGVSWKEAFGFSKPPVGRAIMLGAVAAIVFLPVGMLLQAVSLWILDWLHLPAPLQTAVEGFDETTPWINRAYLAFFAVVIAPVAEEIFFRGMFFSVIKRAGFPRLALWISALLFAASHVNASVFLPLLVLGLMLAWLYNKTENLLVPIAAHGVFNAINVVLLVGDDLKTEFLKFTHHTR